MDADDALWAVKLVQPKLAIPMHYNTFPLIKADPHEFVGRLSKQGFNGKVMEIGEELSF